MYCKLRSFRQIHSAGLTKLEVPRHPEVTDFGSCTEWITVATPVEVEQRLCKCNQRHFGQAEGSFPAVPPFSEWVNWSASTHTAELLLEGSCPLPSNLDPLTVDLLAHLRCRCSLDDIPGPISIEDWNEKIENWPESTSTSPSGFHLTQSTALLARHNVDLESPKGIELEKMCETLIAAQVSLINLAITHWYSYEQWKTVVNVMILKEPGNHKIHRVHVIHLYKHNYNLLLAVKWRLLIQMSTQQQRLHHGQFGGIPGCGPYSQL